MKRILILGAGFALLAGCTDALATANPIALAQSVAESCSKGSSRLL
jgi:hypothetical protein